MIKGPWGKRTETPFSPSLELGAKDSLFAHKSANLKRGGSVKGSFLPASLATWLALALALLHHVRPVTFVALFFPHLGITFGPDVVDGVIQGHGLGLDLGCVQYDGRGHHGESGIAEEAFFEQKKCQFINT